MKIWVAILVGPKALTDLKKGLYSPQIVITQSRFGRMKFYPVFW